MIKGVLTYFTFENEEMLITKRFCVETSKAHKINFSMIVYSVDFDENEIKLILKEDALI